MAMWNPTPWLKDEKHSYNKVGWLEASDSYMDYLQWLQTVNKIHTKQSASLRIIRNISFHGDKNKLQQLAIAFLANLLKQNHDCCYSR